jgi:enamine deaminase RidA (YjgF/YER057c/UK114 family)
MSVLRAQDSTQVSTVTSDTIKRVHPGKRLSDAVVHGSTIYLAGQVASDPSAGIKDQARDVLSQIDRILGELGSSKMRLLSVTIYLADMADYAAMNEVWDAWVPKSDLPARATVQAKLARPEFKIEIQAIAAI